MGYLNNQVITVDAILTEKGRQLLAQQDGTFQITQFALADDEVDYTLYNPNHPSGSAYYGEAIENMPLLEAFPKTNQIMKYKLATLPRGTSKMPILNVGYTNISVPQGGQLNIKPQTMNYLGNNSVYETSGYIFTISDVRLFSTFDGVGISTTQAAALNATTTTGTNVSKTVIGTTVSMVATTINTLFSPGNNFLQSTLIVEGRDSGARVVIPVTVTQI